MPQSLPDILKTLLARKIESIEMVESFIISCELHMRTLESIETLSLRSAMFFNFQISARLMD